MTQGNRTCPSADCAPGAEIIGVVRADGEIAYVSPPLEVDELLAGELRGADRDPRERFRFAQPCVEERCAWWDGARCGAIDHAMSWGVRRTTLPRCAIRPRCRWFAQSGPAACATCALVVTKVGASTVRTPDPTP